jgi:HK97 family phage major capsid protein
MELRELREQRGKLIAQGRDLIGRAEKENRGLTDEEKANYDKYLADAQALKDRIEREERQRELDRESAGRDADRTRQPAPGAEPAPELRAEYRSLWVRSQYSEIRNNGAGRRIDPLSARERTRLEDIEAQLRAAKSYRAWQRLLAFGMAELSADERRDLQMGADPSGGFTVPPEQFQATLIRKVDDLVYIRGLATKQVVTKAQDLGVPTLEDNPADSDWTSELATGSADTTMDFGKRTFAPHPLAKQMKVSKKLLRASVIDIEALITDRFAYKFGITQEKAFLLGNGSQQPLGLFVASGAGIDTSRDVSTGNTTTAIAADGLVNAKFTLKEAYQKKARWLFHRTVVREISKLKNGDGQYLWQPTLQAGQPDMLLGLPVMISEYAPNTFTTGQYVGLIGDFSQYWIADALDMTIQRLIELYAASNQEGFIMRMELDGMPVLAEAFARVTLA